MLEFNVLLEFLILLRFALFMEKNLSSFKGSGLRVAYKAIDSSFYLFAVKPLIMALPSATIALYKWPSAKGILSPAIFQWIDENIFIVVTGYFLIPLFVITEDFIKKKAPAYFVELSAEGQNLLLKSLNLPVDKKMNRFLLFLKEHSNQKLTPGQIFKDITNPDVQLAEIIRAIHLFFEGYAKLHNRKTINFTTVLFKIKEGRPVESWCYFPEGNRPNDELLNDSTSLAAQTVKENRMIIVEDIQKEKEKIKNNKKSKISANCQQEEGSELCFPIRLTAKNTIPLVLGVTASECFFLVENSVLYENILETFRKRIIIEYTLSEMKSHVSKPQN